MLTVRHRHPHGRRRVTGARRQRGIVLILALIVLVAMALAAVALTRSTYTSNVIAGNLAFQQAATTSADQGVETAVAWLENNNGQSSSTTATTCSTSVGSTVLACDQASHGYIASRTDPSSSQTWPDLWTALVAAGTTPVALSVDSAGNTVSYIIQRMCSAAGDAASTTCSTPPATSSCSNCSKASDSSNLTAATQFYYRITVQVSGARSTRSYAQAMVAL
jgi:Tfp pilus assembly protein PilX